MFFFFFLLMFKLPKEWKAYKCSQVSCWWIATPGSFLSHYFLTQNTRIQDSKLQNSTKQTYTNNLPVAQEIMNFKKQD